MEFRLVSDLRQWHGAKAVRQAVFVKEQSCPPQEEWDEFDQSSRHFVGEVDGKIVATARWREVEKGGLTYAKLERFAILVQHRGGGQGKALVAAVLEDARNQGHRRFLLHAQAHLQKFYGFFGFLPQGEPFFEAGIPHVEMTLEDGLGPKH